MKVKNEKTKKLSNYSNEPARDLKLFNFGFIHLEDRPIHKKPASARDAEAIFFYNSPKPFYCPVRTIGFYSKAILVVKETLKN